jgi:RNA polymerase sigma-70 factor (ECF subfamily)
MMQAATINQPMEFLAKHHASSQAMQDEWEEIKEAKLNPARFEILYDRYYERIFSFVYQRLEDKELAFDTSSQVFLKAMQSLHKYEFRGLPFASWLFRIAKSEVYQLFRDRKAERTVNIDKVSLKGMSDEIEEDIYGPYLEILKSSIAELEEGELQLVEMRFFEKRSFKEIGEILNITENNSKVKVYRILDKLKKILISNKKPDKR